jgi:hypothetical protein
MMNLKSLKNNWESLAERDALFAILTDQSRVGGKWKVAEFMATGETEIDTVMHSQLRRRGIGLWVRRWPGNAGPGAALCLLRGCGYFSAYDSKGRVSEPVRTLPLHG